MGGGGREGGDGPGGPDDGGGADPHHTHRGKHRPGRPSGTKLNQKIFEKNGLGIKPGIITLATFVLYTILDRKIENSFAFERRKVKKLITFISWSIKSILDFFQTRLSSI